jgi:hypothetical protein
VEFSFIFNYFSFLFLSEGGEDIDEWTVEDLQAVIAEYNHYYGGGEAAPEETFADPNQNQAPEYTADNQ